MRARSCDVTLQRCEGRLHLSLDDQHVVNGCAESVRRAHENDSQHDERDD
jgi:hypothetical protein